MRKLIAGAVLAVAATLAATSPAWADVNIDVDASHAAEHAADHALQNAEIATNPLTGASVLNGLGGILNGLDLLS